MELNMEHLDKVVGGAMMDQAEIEKVAMSTCLGCKSAGLECWDYLKKLKAQFEEDPNLKQVEVHCPKGVLDI